MRALSTLSAILLTAGPALPAEYTLFGQYYGNSQGPTEEFIHWPDNDGDYGYILRWGYNIWNQDRVEPVVAPPGWILSQNLCEPPYNVPMNATAVRVHIKAKVAGLTFATEKMHSAVQIKFRQAGTNTGSNEMIHATTQKPANLPTTTPYDLNHVEVDILLGPDCKIEMFRHPTITGRMLIEVATFLAGYWAPVE